MKGPGHHPTALPVGIVMRALALAFLAVVLRAPSSPLDGQLFLTQEEALEIAFPGDVRIERETAFLDGAQIARVRELAGPGVDIERTVVTYYVARADGKPRGVAYFDAHRVRTLPEVVMIVVSPRDRIERIEILKFSEPPDYLAPEGWLEQFEGQTLDDELSTKGEIVNMTGATLTSDAVTEAARRVLALHRVVDPFASGTAIDGTTANGPDPRDGSRR